MKEMARDNHTPSSIKETACNRKELTEAGSLMLEALRIKHKEKKSRP